MNRVLVELLWDPTGRSYDLDLPSNVVTRDLAELLASAMGGESDDLAWELLDAASGTALSPDRDLASLGVWSGARLRCRAAAKAIGEAVSGQVILRTSTGHCHRLSDSPVLLGRRRMDQSPAPHPLIDLSSESGGRTVSREHALLRQTKEGWTIEHLSTASNPTLVEGKPLAAGEQILLRSGDRIQLGAVRLTFSQTQDLHD